MQNSLRIISTLQQSLAALLPMKAEDKLRLDKKFRLEFNYNSNHLEGNTLTYGETELLLIFDDTKGNHQLREYEEMKAHDVAWQLVQEWAGEAERPLTEADIKNLNGIILVRSYWKDAETLDGQKTRRQIKVGDYKDLPNSVRLANGEIFHYTSPADTPIEMGELIQWYRSEEEKGELHPVALAALLHYRFVRIHPFDDGNGRISRLLMNYVMLRNGLQPVIIKSAEKQSYLHALHLADIGDLDAFVDYVALQEQWSLNMAIKAVRGENLDEPGDLDKKLFLLKKKLGQNTSESKIVKKSSEAISRFISESFHSLVDELESKYLEFDTLFYSRRVRVSIDNLQASGTDIYSVFASLWNPLLQRNEELDISVIQISISFHRLRESRTDININGGNLSVSFYDNVYEINFTAAARPVTKLYSEGLSAEECRYIIESLGNFVVESVEVALERESTDN